MNQTQRAINRFHRIRYTIETLTLILLMSLVIRSALQNFHIQGQSMEPTIHDQEFILVNKTAYLFQPPERGDVIVFTYPLDTKENYIKRIIAIPGDIVSIVGTHVTVNGVTIHETYVNSDDNFNPYPPIIKHIINPDEYFVMGDNRGNSSDSRQWGLVPRKNIIGKVAIVYWPLDVNNFGLLPNDSNVFAHVS